MARYNLRKMQKPYYLLYTFQIKDLLILSLISRKKHYFFIMRINLFSQVHQITNVKNVDKGLALDDTLSNKTFAKLKFKSISLL